MGAPELGVEEVGRDGLQEDPVLVPHEVQLGVLGDDEFAGDEDLVVW